MGQRVADHVRLLVNFLGHEMAIVGLVDDERRPTRFQHLAGNDRAIRVLDHPFLARQHHPVTVLEVADGIGKGSERDRIGTEIHLAVAIADRQRRTLACSDQKIAISVEKEHQRKGAAQLRQRRPHGFLRRRAHEQVGMDEMDDDFGIGLAREVRALLFQRLAQFAEILDDAVVHHGDALGRMWMGIVLGRLAVRGPARVTDAGITGEWLGKQPRFQVLELALGSAAFETTVIERGHARRIVAAIFEPLE